jgi:hypothetical protein
MKHSRSLLAAPASRSADLRASGATKRSAAGACFGHDAREGGNEI